MMSESLKCYFWCFYGWAVLSLSLTHFGVIPILTFSVPFLCFFLISATNKCVCVCVLDILVWVFSTEGFRLIYCSVTPVMDPWQALQSSVRTSRDHYQPHTVPHTATWLLLPQGHLMVKRTWDEPSANINNISRLPLLYTSPPCHPSVNTQAHKPTPIPAHSLEQDPDCQFWTFKNCALVVCTTEGLLSFSDIILLLHTLYLQYDDSYNYSRRYIRDHHRFVRGKVPLMINRHCLALFISSPTGQSFNTQCYYW